MQSFLARRRSTRPMGSVRRAALSIETILILAAIAVPILIFILKVGWPKIQKYFNESTDTLIEESYNTQQGRAERLPRNRLVLHDRRGRPPARRARRRRVV